MDRLLRKPVLATALLGLTRHGEKSWRYHLGDLIYTVGFLDDAARYLAGSKASGGDFRKADLLGLLTAELPATEWTFSPSFKDTPDIPLELPKKGRPRRPPSQLFTAQRTDSAGKNACRQRSRLGSWPPQPVLSPHPLRANAQPLPIDQATITARLG